MAEHVLLVTGRMARQRLANEMARLGELPFTWQVEDIGVKVAALITEPILMRRLKQPDKADRIILPGRVRADLGRLAEHFGIPFERGPDEIADLANYFGRGGRPPDLSRHDMRIFAEIVEAPLLSVDAIVERAMIMSRAGADVIDLGGLPDTPFEHLEDAVQALKAQGLKVSVDSADLDELRRGARAGCDAIFSLNKNTLALAADTGVESVLVPEDHGDLDSLGEAIEEAERLGLRYMADPILDPIHFGFVPSLQRYAELRRRYPDAPMLMGTGNVTELTDADTSGITAVLAGICSELSIGNVLVVHVSPHTLRTIEEHDVARRMMYASRLDDALPRGYGNGLLQVHERKPFASTPEDIAAMASQVKDRSYRIEVAADGIHLYSSAGHHVAGDAMALFEHLDVAGDGAHAFYLGTELMKAELAFKLGKRYAQDEPLHWGVSVPASMVDKTRLAEAGHTLRKTKLKDA